MTSAVISSVGLVTGQLIAMPSGEKCYNHRSVDASVRMVGDICMGVAEVYDYCKTCHDEIKEEEKKVKEAGEICDWCNNVKRDCKNHRDWQEGNGGPVYTVCLDCRRKENDELARELSDY